MILIGINLNYEIQKSEKKQKDKQIKYRQQPVQQKDKFKKTMSFSQVENNISQCEVLKTNQHMSKSQQFRCYLRMPDMRSIIQNISTGCSVKEVKKRAKQLFNLSHVNNPEDIRLVVNEVQLIDGMDLNQHLFHNAIVHVIVHTKHHNQQHSQQSQQQKPTTFTLRIKQPPVNCPILTIPSISIRQTIKSIKSKILSFYSDEYPQNEISQLKQNQLYLVYGGKVLMDKKILEEYDIDQNGVLYVVNGRLYVREVTKQEAQRRINEVKGKVAIQKVQIVQKDQQQQQQNLDSQIKQQQAADTVQFNIIQNIVHDSDSQVQGEVTDNLTRSQKIIQRYNSISRSNPVQQEGQQKNKNIVENENKQSRGLDIEQVEERPFVEVEQEQEQQSKKQQTDEIEQYVVSGKGNSYKMIDVIVKDEKELTWEEKIGVDSYLDFVNQQVADYQATRQQYNQQLLQQQQPTDIVLAQQAQSQQQKNREQEQQPTPMITPQTENNDQSYQSNNEEMLI